MDISYLFNWSVIGNTSSLFFGNNHDLAFGDDEFDVSLRFLNKQLVMWVRLSEIRSDHSFRNQ